MRTIYRATIELTARELEAIKRITDSPESPATSINLSKESFKMDFALALSVLRAVADKALLEEVTDNPPPQ